MTTLTNEQMLNNVMTIIKKMDINEDDDFKKEMNKVINKAMKDKTTVKKTKEPKEPKELTPYQQFVKDKMPEVKEKYDPKERMKAIAELWKEQKESSGSE
jgi:predicted solute-binding protein